MKLVGRFLSDPKCEQKAGLMVLSPVALFMIMFIFLFRVSDYDPNTSSLHHLMLELEEFRVSSHHEIIENPTSHFTEGFTSVQTIRDFVTDTDFMITVTWIYPHPPHTIKATYQIPQTHSHLLYGLSWFGHI